MATRTLNIDSVMKLKAFNTRFQTAEARESGLRGTELHYANIHKSHGANYLINALRKKEA